MTITMQKRDLEAYQGTAVKPDRFEAYWRKKWNDTVPSGKPRINPVNFQNAQGIYEEWTIPVSHGEDVHVRYICPSAGENFPTILMFHDLGRGVRGWHHMTRFLALGYAVAALENRTAVTQWQTELPALNLDDCYSCMMIMAHAVLEYPKTNPNQLLTWGEGFGGGLAIAAASIVPGVKRCAALNPLPGDLRKYCSDPYEGEKDAMDYYDPVNFAPTITCPVLLGTGLLDRKAPPEIQYAIFNRILSPKKHLVYPKYEHERINYFENEQLKFFNIWR